MTASPLAELPGLVVDLGEHSRPWSPAAGRWLRFPAADYRCACGHEDSASGDAVAAFVATARRIHRAQCPIQKGG